MVDSDVLQSSDTLSSVTIVHTTHNQDAVSGPLSSLIDSSEQFCSDGMNFLDSKIDSVSFTGRTSDGNVDVSDALSTNVINEINKLKFVLSDVYPVNISSFCEITKSSAIAKDNAENAARENAIIENKNDSSEG